MEIKCCFCVKDVIINKIRNCTECGCCGTIRYVHDECLATFFESMGYKNIDINCNICNKKYTFSNYIMIRRFLKFYKSREEYDLYIKHMSHILYNHHDLCKIDPRDEIEDAIIIASFMSVFPLYSLYCIVTPFLIVCFNIHFLPEKAIKIFYVFHLIASCLGYYIQKYINNYVEFMIINFLLYMKPDINKKGFDILFIFTKPITFILSIILHLYMIIIFIIDIWKSGYLF